MDYFKNRSFNIGLIVCFISGGIFIATTLFELPLDIIIMNGLFGLFGFISLMKGITDTKIAREQKE